MTRLIVFDADGTLRRTLVPGQPCPRHPREWALIEGVRERLQREPPDVEFAVASNQDQIGYGLIDESMACEMLLDLLRMASGRRIAQEAVRYCPHRSDVACACRKPAPGMLLSLMDLYCVRPEETLFVGDGEVDRVAARRAGTRFAWANDYFERGVLL